MTRQTLSFDDSFFSNTPAKRFLAWVIDSVLIAVGVALIVPLTLFTGLLFIPFLFLTLGLVYRWVSVAGMSATPGMWLVGIEFRTQDGQKFDASLAFWHALGFTVSMSIFPLQLLSIGLMLTTERKTGLSDVVLRSFVINRPLGR